MTKKKAATPRQKQMMEDLLNGCRLVITKNFSGRVVYKVLTPDMSPKYYLGYKAWKQVKDLLKQDKAGLYTLNLSKVRQMHGNSSLKSSYKARRNEKTDNSAIPTQSSVQEAAAGDFKQACDPCIVQHSFQNNSGIGQADRV